MKQNSLVFDAVHVLTMLLKDPNNTGAPFGSPKATICVFPLTVPVRRSTVRRLIALSLPKKMIPNDELPIS